MASHRLASGLVLVLLLAVSWPARAQPTRTASQRVHLDAGIEHFRAGRFQDAAREFTTAYELSGRAELLFNAGRAFESAADNVRAIGAYERFLGSPNVSAGLQEQTRTRLAVLRETQAV